MYSTKRCWHFLYDADKAKRHTVRHTVYAGVYHTPLGRFSKVDSSTTNMLPNTERHVSGKLSARCFQRRPFWHRHYSNCGDFDHGKSAQEGVIYTVVYGWPHSCSTYIIPLHAAYSLRIPSGYRQRRRLMLRFKCAMYVLPSTT